jgi:hypothetical protein
MIKKINILAPKIGSKEITSQLDLGIAKDTDLGEIGMGVLSDCQFASNRDPFSRPIPTPPERIDLTT